MTQALREKIARIIAPTSWAVMDSYFKDFQRKYKGQNVGYPEDQFWHKESLKTADDILALPDLQGGGDEQLGVSLTNARQLLSRLKGRPKTETFAHGSLAPEMLRRSEEAIEELLEAVEEWRQPPTAEAGLREQISLLMDNTLNADWSVDSIGRTGAFVTSISKEQFLHKLLKLIEHRTDPAAQTAEPHDFSELELEDYAIQMADPVPAPVSEHKAFPFRSQPMDDELKALIAKSRAYVDSLTPEQRREMIRQQGESWARAEASFDEDANITTYPVSEPKDDIDNLVDEIEKQRFAYAMTSDRKTLVAMATAMEELAPKLKALKASILTSEPKDSAGAMEAKGSLLRAINGGLVSTKSSGNPDPKKRSAEFRIQWHGDGSLAKCDAFYDAFRSHCDTSAAPGQGGA